MAEHFLSLNQSQRLSMVLAPQMRQSLELLQVPTLELRTLVRQEMEQNPTLEEQELENEPLEIEPALAETEDDEAFQDEFDQLARLDDEWRDYFKQNQPRGPSSEELARRQHFLNSLTQPQSLQQHLMDQLNLSVVTPQERAVGELLVGSINEDGYLASSLEDLASASGHPLEALQDMLNLVQEFDPVGVGARDLPDCLLLQLRRLGKADDLAAVLVRDHLAALAGHHLEDLARTLKVPPAQVQQAARLIATLEPRPGRRFASDATAYVLPDVMVYQTEDGYGVLLNNEQIPRLHISEQYRHLMADEDTSSEVKAYIREKVRAGMFLIKSINQRQQTIYNLAREIVNVQRAFFDQGISHLRPLTMAEVATVLGIHETTVSRALANKYMQTPRGTFEMKYFFTPGYRKADGESVSNKTIKDAIARMVAEEDPAHPLSDQVIVEKLKEQGLQVARRTIAKYRDELKILPSHLRRERRGTSP